MKITADKLLELGAEPECADLATFYRLWPRGATVTLRRALRAMRAGLDIGWLAGRVLTGAAGAAYEEAIAPAWAAYDEAVARAFVDALAMQEGVRA